MSFFKKYACLYLYGSDFFCVCMCGLGYVCFFFVAWVFFFARHFKFGDISCVMYRPSVTVGLPTLHSNDGVGHSSKAIEAGLITALQKASSLKTHFLTHQHFEGFCLKNNTVLSFVKLRLVRTARL